VVAQIRAPHTLNARRQSSRKTCEHTVELTTRQARWHSHESTGGPVAWESGDLRPESQYCERLQPRQV